MRIIGTKEGKKEVKGEEYQKTMQKYPLTMIVLKGKGKEILVD